MKRVFGIVVLIVIAICSASPLGAQTVSWSDPSRPGLLKVNVLNGSITVKGYSGRDVVVDAKPRVGGNRRGGPPPEAGGLRRIDQTATGLAIEEKNNVMTIGTSAFDRGADIEIQVPAKTNLNLESLNGGSITVEGVEGEIEVTNLNGGITLTDVGGAILAHSLNGRVIVSLRQATANKPMAFTSMNGNVDVTLPASTKANLKMRTDHGEIYSDFDVQLRASDNKPTVEDTRKQGGRYRIETDKTISGAVNGGGPDFDLHTMNGNIYIRKGK